MPQSAKPRAAYCSPGCGTKYRNARRLEREKAERRAALVPIDCAQCGKAFEPDRKNAKFCSKACYVRAKSSSRTEATGVQFTQSHTTQGHRSESWTNDPLSIPEEDVTPHQRMRRNVDPMHDLRIAMIEQAIADARNGARGEWDIDTCASEHPGASAREWLLGFSGATLSFDECLEALTPDTEAMGAAMVESLRAEGVL